ncbi:MAG TPA: GntR family transcriptional regulator [Chloroflexota bacterium]|nr:GntR family transcriptional regulator [Chloroflexota bacterium]
MLRAGGYQVERAYELLRLRILDGELSVGQRLPSYPTLARELGVSSVTVRLAVQRLAHEGLVSVRVGAGTFVAQPVAQARRRQTGAVDVLIADSDPDSHAATVERLEAEGHRVTLVESAGQMLLALARATYSHLFLDVHMPGSGAEMAATLAEAYPRTVVAMMGHSLAHVVGSGRGCLVIQKPVQPLAVADVLSLRRA